jgi:hypothetical protein
MGLLADVIGVVQAPSARSLCAFDDASRVVTDLICGLANRARPQERPREKSIPWSEGNSRMPAIGASSPQVELARISTGGNPGIFAGRPACDRRGPLRGQRDRANEGDWEVCARCSLRSGVTRVDEFGPAPLAKVVCR